MHCRWYQAFVECTELKLVGENFELKELLLSPALGTKLELLYAALFVEELHELKLHTSCANILLAVRQ